MNFLRNWRFLSVILPLPSILIRYLLNPRSSITMPDLSHFFETFPAPYWFWTKTFDPMSREGRSFVCSDHFSAPLRTLFLIASSRFSLQSIQTSDGENCPGLIGRKSRIGRPNNNWAGDNPNSVSGVFLCCMVALIILSNSGVPSSLVLSITILLADFTEVSALRFDFG